MFSRIQTINFVCTFSNKSIVSERKILKNVCDEKFDAAFLQGTKLLYKICPLNDIFKRRALYHLQKKI